MRLSVVIPCYNEEGRLMPTLTRILAFLKAKKISFEIIVVDDGSKDSTPGLVRAMMRKEKCLRLAGDGLNHGKGHAVRLGVEAAKGEQILFSDADLSTPIEEYLALAAALGPQVSLAIGSRALSGARITRHQPLYRELAGRFFNTMVRLITLSGISDTQCGFKLFKADAARRIFALQRIPRFGFDVEALYLAKKFGYGIAQCPVAWENSPETKVRPIRDGARTFLDLALIRIYDLMGSYR